MYLYSQYRRASKALLQKYVYLVTFEALYNFQHVTNKLDFHLFQKQNNEFQSGEGNTAFLVCTCICCEKHEFPDWLSFMDNRWTVLNLSEREDEKD